MSETPEQLAEWVASRLVPGRRSQVWERFIRDFARRVREAGAQDHAREMAQARDAGWVPGEE